MDLAQGEDAVMPDESPWIPDAYRTHLVRTGVDAVMDAMEKEDAKMVAYLTELTQAIINRLVPELQAQLAEHGISDPELLERYRLLAIDATNLGLQAAAGLDTTELAATVKARAEMLTAATGYTIAIELRTLLLAALDNALKVGLAVAL